LDDRSTEKFEAVIGVKTRPTDGNHAVRAWLRGLNIPSPVLEQRSRQPLLLSRRNAQELGLGGPDRPTRHHSAGRPHQPSTKKVLSLFSDQIIVPLVAILCEISGGFWIVPPLPELCA
jgi:hypothetical protein